MGSKDADAARLTAVVIDADPSAGGVCPCKPPDLVAAGIGSLVAAGIAPPDLHVERRGGAGHGHLDCTRALIGCRAQFGPDYWTGGNIQGDEGPLIGNDDILFVSEVRNCLRKLKNLEVPWRRVSRTKRPSTHQASPSKLEFGTRKKATGIESTVRVGAKIPHIAAVGISPSGIGIAQINGAETAVILTTEIQIFAGVPCWLIDTCHSIHPQRMGRPDGLLPVGVLAIGTEVRVAIDTAVRSKKPRAGVDGNSRVEYDIAYIVVRPHRSGERTRPTSRRYSTRTRRGRRRGRVAALGLISWRTAQSTSWRRRIGGSATRAPESNVAIP
jgi:hypothetical protein